MQLTWTKVYTNEWRGVRNGSLVAVVWRTPGSAPRWCAEFYGNGSVEPSNVLQMEVLDAEQGKQMVEDIIALRSS